MASDSDYGEKSDLNFDDIEKNNISDWVSMTARGVFGAVPWVGGLFSEVITQLIPNQRQDRIVKFLKVLSKNVENLSHQELITKLHDPYHLDLFEDACFQAVRALSDERLEYIASALKNGLTDKELEHTYKKKLLWLLGQLNDNEIVILFFYYIRHTDKHDVFLEKHKDIIRDMPKTMNMPENEYTKATIHNSFKNRLIDLELLSPRFKKPKKNEFPSFDLNTGMIEILGLNITPLGRTLCNFIELEKVYKDQI